MTSKLSNCGRITKPIHSLTQSYAHGYFLDRFILGISLTHCEIQNADIAIKVVSGSPQFLQIERTQLKRGGTGIMADARSDLSIDIIESTLNNLDSNGIHVVTSERGFVSLTMRNSIIKQCQLSGIIIESNMAGNTQKSVSLALTSVEFVNNREYAIIVDECDSILLSTRLNNCTLRNNGGSLFLHSKTAEFQAVDCTMYRNDHLVDIRVCGADRDYRNINFTNNAFSQPPSSGHVTVTLDSVATDLQHAISFWKNTFSQSKNNNGQFLTLMIHRKSDVIITNNAFKMFKEAGIYGLINNTDTSFSVTNNSFENGRLAMEVMLLAPSREQIIISGNNFSHNTGDPIVAIQALTTLPKPIVVTRNDFVDNSGTVLQILTPDILVYHNAFINPLASFNMKFNKTGDGQFIINATRNFWGTTVVAEISSKILDKEMRSELPLINFVPYLASRNVSDIFVIEPVFIGMSGAEIILNGEITLTIDESPYRVVRDVLIGVSDTVIIQPGVSLLFKKNQKFTVKGV